MLPSFSELDIEKLSVNEKLELIGILWDSITDTSEALPIPEWHRQELERRLDAADATPELSIPWEQVKTRLQRQP